MLRKIAFLAVTAIAAVAIATATTRGETRDKSSTELKVEIGRAQA